MSKTIIGSVELCDLPELGISNLPIRVDTGAKTSSLHVDNIAGFRRAGRRWVRFDLHPDVHNVSRVVHCEAPVSDLRRVRSSNGRAEKRYVITTAIALAGMCWPIELTLTDRSDMSYLMLFGREGMGERVLVDPSRDFLVSAPVPALTAPI